MAPIRTAARFLRSVPSPLPSPTCANPAPLHSADSKRDKRTARHNSWIDKLVRQSHSRVAKKTVGKSIKSPTKGNALLMDDLKDLVSELETEVAALAGQRNVDRSDCPKSLPRKSTASLSQKKRRRLGVDEAIRFQQILAMDAFKKNGLAALKIHIKNTSDAPS